MIFWASPLGRDRKTKSKFFQSILFIEEIKGNFFLFFDRKNLFFYLNF